MKNTRFVLFSMPRTGSVMITERLSTHPDVFFAPAVFSKLGWPHGERGNLAKRLRYGMSLRWSDYDTRVGDYAGFLEEMFAVNSDCEWIGFKHHISGESAITDQIIADERFAKIVLIRSNYLASYSSQKITELTKQGRVSAGQEAVKAKGVFDPEEFGQHVRIRDRVYGRLMNRVASGGEPWMSLDYTDARTADGIERIMNFLGIDPFGLGPWNTAKRNSDDIVNRFANADDVRSYITAKNLESWATEG